MTRHARRGFTLLELLVVIGVILLLVAIGVYAFSKLEKVAGEKSTTTRLALCALMLSEYEVTAGSLQGIESKWPLAASAYTMPPYPPSVFNLGTKISSPGDVNSGSLNRYSQKNGSGIRNPAVLNSGLAMQVCLGVPNVKTMLAQLPAASLLLTNSGNTAVPQWVETDGKTVIPQTPVPVVVDAWKNPIILVPSGGMGVTVGGVSKTVVAEDLKPFWASAGQDGNFSNGDDNLYSSPVRYK